MRYLLASLLYVFTQSLTAQVDCPNAYDGNGDGAIGISDLLEFLVLYGDVDSDSDGVFDSEDDCIDYTACNFQSNPTEPCDYIYVVGQCCGDFIEHEGYFYSTVQIGEQCWFSENCRYLPEISGSHSYNSPTFHVYGYNSSDVEAAQSTWNYLTYGVLYNWVAVMESEICPNSWHVPTDTEWTQLTDFLGGENAAGEVMKSGHGYYYDPDEANSSGFTGLPGGYCYPTGPFGQENSSGFFWSSSAHPGGGGNFNSWMRELSITNTTVTRETKSQRSGLSVRCVRY